MCPVLPADIGAGSTPRFRVARAVFARNCTLLKKSVQSARDYAYLMLHKQFTDGYRVTHPYGRVQRRGLRHQSALRPLPAAPSAYCLLFFHVTPNVIWM
jgi:hypothetical protein